MTVSAPVWQIDFNACRPFLLSVVVPVYNEIQVLPQFMERLTAVLESIKQPYEILLVDDGSTDGSGDMMQRFVLTMPSVRVIWLSRNFGKEAAVTAGLAKAKGDAAVLIDADLQDPPELIPEMVDNWRDGADMVCMRRRSRAGENWFKRTSASLFYRLLNRISRFDIPPDTGDFRLMSRRVLNALNRLPERNRYMKGLFAWVGMPTRVLMYDRDPRAAGVTKWRPLSLMALAFEGITSFSIAPLRWVTAAGIVAAMWGALFGFWIVFKALFMGDPVAGYPSMMAVMTFLGGVQLLTVGLVGEYVGKIYTEVKQRPIYQIRETSDDMVGRPVCAEEHHFASR
ncbi:MAG: glycosyltransferase family 2 protein [Ketobacter sp.]|nr:glycosyltransferase family 2 protein [Ketobacter sp.]